MIISQKELKKITSAKCADIYNYLGMHKCDGGAVVRCYLDDAKKCGFVDSASGAKTPMKKLDESGFFELFIKGGKPIDSYFFEVSDYRGGTRVVFDAYSFGPTLTDTDVYLIGKGDERRIYDKLGSHVRTIRGVEGVGFAVWAPTARRVSVVGDFNEWDGRYNQMRPVGQSGIWEIFVPSAKVGDKYKYEILAADNDTPFLKIDPYAVRFEPAPNHSSIVWSLDGYEWGDAEWLERRAKTDFSRRAVSVYEVHLGSWKRVADDGFRPLTYVEIGRELAAYCAEMNFTHVEFMPLAEYPFDGSWGYQVTGFYAPTQRYGTPRDFMEMVDILHRNGIGVILDWVPAHFPRDSFALAGYDGSCLYEHQDPRLGANPDWGTLCFNYGRAEVSNFLMGSALAWFDRFHIDGLRVDAVASMLYLNFSRKDWIPNRYGGAENLEAIEFLKHTNAVIHEEFGGALMIAEESTTFEGVTKPVSEGGLGFDLKWNLGWMHDTLDYMKENPVNRKYHHNKMTFPSMYQFDEKFMLVYSHDEVVHGKSPMIGKMGAFDWNEKIANLRALYAYMWFWPGKKTLFMGDEIAQSTEWKYDDSVDWRLLKYEVHRSVRDVVRDSARLYLQDASLAAADFDRLAFQWINADDGNYSIYSFLRHCADGKTCYAVVSNFTPVLRTGYGIGLPFTGTWSEVLNTDSDFYCGTGAGNFGAIRASEEFAMHNQPCGALVIVPPMSTVVFKGVRPESSRFLPREKTASQKHVRENAEDLHASGAKTVGRANSVKRQNTAPKRAPSKNLSAGVKLRKPAATAKRGTGAGAAKAKKMPKAKKKT